MYPNGFMKTGFPLDLQNSSCKWPRFLPAASRQEAFLFQRSNPCLHGFRQHVPVSYTHLDVYKRQSVLRPQVQQIRLIADIGIPLKHPGQVGRRKSKQIRHALQGDILVVILLHIGGNPGQLIQMTLLPDIAQMCIRDRISTWR